MGLVCALSYLHKTLVFAKTLQAFPILIESKEEFPLLMHETNTLGEPRQFLSAIIWVVRDGRLVEWSVARTTYRR